MSKQFQGVETYSQIRYVHYFQSLYRDKIRDLPSRPLLVTGVNITGVLLVLLLTFFCEIRIKIFFFVGLRHVGAGDGSDFSLTVYSGGAEVWRAGFSAVEHCRLTGAPELDRVDGDILLQAGHSGQGHQVHVPLQHQGRPQGRTQPQYSNL